MSSVFELVLGVLEVFAPFLGNSNKHTMLCLGDSYTIGESVQEQERFPVQATEFLEKYGVSLSKPVIIAKTGWTTDELDNAIHEQKLKDRFEVVTLLIGVNNQYRGRDPEEYRQQFNSLLRLAIRYASAQPNHVYVLSIPDWGVTPFVVNDAKKRTAGQIGKEIDVFNAINKEETAKLKAHYIDITPASRLAATDPTLTATDGLHPSGKMYREWAILLAAAIRKQFFK